jgi:hypothetical protein
VDNTKTGRILAIAYPRGFTYALGKLDQAIEELEGAGEIKERLDAADRTLAPIFPDSFPEPLRTEYASIREALTWLPGGQNQGDGRNHACGHDRRRGQQSFCSTYNTKGDDPYSLDHTPKPDGAIEGLGFQKYYATCCVGHRTVGSRGSGRGCHPFPTQITIHSLLVVVLPPAAVSLPSILGVWRSSKSL